MTETDNQASPFLNSPSVVTFETTFLIRPEAVGSNMERSRAPKQHTQDTSQKPNQLQRRRSMFIQREFNNLPKIVTRTPPIFHRDLVDTQPSDNSTNDLPQPTEQTQKKHLSRRLSNM